VTAGPPRFAQRGTRRSRHRAPFRDGSLIEGGRATDPWRWAGVQEILVMAATDEREGCHEAVFAGPR
jgi:hypothetical protein